MPQHSRRRTIGIVLAIAAVVAGAVFFYLRGANEAPAAPVTTAVTRGDVVAQVTASGTLAPVELVQVGSQISGRIRELLVDYNDKVEKGQIIARIDPELLTSAMEQARARLSSARASLTRAQAVFANAKAQHARLAGLAAEGTVAGAEVDTALAAMRSAEADLVASRAEITVAQAAVGQSKTNLDYTTIRSPIDGVVVSRSVEVGQTVAASLSAPVLFTIAGDLRQMEVHTSVAEADVGQITSGMKVEFTVDAFPERTFTAKVDQVRYEAVTVSNVVTYDAVVLVDNADLSLRPGMTANVTFVTSERKDVLVVANPALRYRPKDAAGPGGERGERPVANGAAAGAGAAPGAFARAADGGAQAQSGEGRRGGRRGRREGGGDDAKQAPTSTSPSTSASTPTPPAAAAAPDGERRRKRPRTLWVLRAGKPEPVRVITGLTDGSITEIVEVLDGQLAEGDQVIVADPGAGAGEAAGGQRGGSQQRGGGRRGPPSIL
jgi:HlyD family secretion protein